MTITLGNCGPESDWPYQGSIEAAKSFGANVELKVFNFIFTNDVVYFFYHLLFLFVNYFNEKKIV